MSDRDTGIAAHYSGYDVLALIKSGLASMGLDHERIDPEVLKPVDEFHIGGSEATAYLLDKLDLSEGTRVLDIGCGIGGTARMVSSRSGAHVTGIDLTPQFVEIARTLTGMCGMDDALSFEVGSATALPFDDLSFDQALMLHVGMNIPDKAGVFAEARRVLKDQGRFAVYDVMRTGPGDIAFPVPWAQSADISFLAAPEDYRKAAADGGFDLLEEENRRDIAIDFFTRLQARTQQQSGPPALGLHQLMGPTVGDKMKNMIGAIRAGTIAPVLMTFRAQAN